MGNHFLYILPPKVNHYASRLLMICNTRHDKVEIPSRAPFFIPKPMERIKNLYLCDWPLRSNAELTMVTNSEGRPVFDWVDVNVDERFAAAVLDKLNGTRQVPELGGEFSAQDESIAYDGHRILDIRGWGWLTDVCGLTGREAQAEQEEFLTLCVRILNDEL